jgi:hypothetical protein
MEHAEDLIKKNKKPSSESVAFVLRSLTNLMIINLAKHKFHAP